MIFDPDEETTVVLEGIDLSDVLRKPGGTSYPVRDCVSGCFKIFGTVMIVVGIVVALLGRYFGVF